jgi:RNA polymerase sigma-70 factor (ECF subfamily)
MALRLADPGDPTPLAFDEFYASHARRVRGLIRRRVTDDAQVEDLVQEVFLRVHRVAAHFDPSRPAWPWLSTITVNVCADNARRRRHDAAPSDDIVELADRVDTQRTDPADLYEDSAQLIAIGTALRAVQPRQRRMLMRREVDGLSYEGLAAIEGVTEDTVRGLLKRARIRFRVEYETAARKGGLLSGIAALRQRWVRFASRAQPSVARWMTASGGLGESLCALAVATGLAVTLHGVESGARPVAAIARATTIGAVPSLNGAAVTHPARADRSTGTAAAVDPAAARPQPITARADAGIDRDGDHMTLFGKLAGGTPGYDNATWVAIDPGCTFNAIWQTACAVADALPPAITR